MRAMRHGEPTSQRELTEAKEYARSRWAMRKAEERKLAAAKADYKKHRTSATGKKS